MAAILECRELTKRYSYLEALSQVDLRIEPVSYTHLTLPTN